jgi:hypothetical protein
MSLAIVLCKREMTGLLPIYKRVGRYQIPKHLPRPIKQLILLILSEAMAALNPGDKSLVIGYIKSPWK